MAYKMRLVLQSINERKEAKEARSYFKTGALVCPRCGGKPKNCTSRWPELPGWSRVLGGDSGPLDSRYGDRLHEGAQQPVLSRKAKGQRLPESGVHDDQALLRRRETHSTMLLTH